MSNRLQVVFIGLALILMGCSEHGGVGSVDADGVDSLDGAGDTADADADAAADADASALPRCYPSPPADFDDHTVSCFESAEDVRAFAGDVTTPPQFKFTMLDFERAEVPSTTFLDPRFYALHDEWYWFRLLNGAPIQGYPVAPVTGLSFDTIAEIYAALAGQSSLPLDLAFVGSSGRLYSRRFYADAGLGPAPHARFFALGSLLYYAADPDRVTPEAFWGFELEYGDPADTGVITKIFHTLEVWLPADITADLRWIARSPRQEAVARELASGGGPYADRTLTYDDLVVSGEVVVYNPGITAGHVKVLAPDFASSEVRATDIAVLARVPDDIPPVAAIASAVPQTPLAHVNLLAKARGTPNAYVAGLLDFGRLGDWEYKRVPVIFQAGDGAVRWQPFACVIAHANGDPDRPYCTYPDYLDYRSLLAPPDREISQVADLEHAPLTVDLTAGGLPDVAGLVPLIGGKCAGMLAFHDFPAMVTPDTPLALTIRGYHDHLAPLVPTLTALLADTAFDADARVRALALEGQRHFRNDNADNAQALGWLQRWLDDHPGGVVRQVVEQGGVVGMIRSAPLDPTYEAAVRAAIETRFAHLSELQGLRFRSSATAEDVVGFNGAGLYDSNTGFLDPTLQPRDKDKKRTIAWAIKKTWASYWGVPAFEERRVAGIDHLAGNMAVLVHPRFDDAYEEANGVMTFFLSTWRDPVYRRLVVNVQAGALSVTNPAGTTAQPEVDEVLLSEGGDVEISRVQPSSEVSQGQQVLSDEELVTLARQVAELADAWLDTQQAELAKPLRARSLVLDLEIKRMAAGWPALASGEVRPGGLIYKQVRVLDGAPLVPDALRDPWEAPTRLATYLPRDVDTAVDHIEALRCSGPAMDVRVFEASTRPSASDLLPFAGTPLIYRVRLEFGEVPPGWAWPSQSPWFIGHTSLSAASVSDDGVITLQMAPQTADFFDLDSLVLDPSAGSWTATRGEREASGSLDDCLSETPFTSPTAFLQGLLDEADATR